MFRRREEIRKQLTKIIAKFREKGVISPEKAAPAEELGLPPRFEETIFRRLGRKAFLWQLTVNIIFRKTG